jgi:hypothetical protein
MRRGEVWCVSFAGSFRGDLSKRKRTFNAS